MRYVRFQRFGFISYLFDKFADLYCLRRVVFCQSMRYLCARQNNRFDRDAYTLAKSAFVEKYTAEAREKYGALYMAPSD